MRTGFFKETSKIGEFFNKKEELVNMDGIISPLFTNMTVWDNDFMLNMIGIGLDLKYGCVEEEVRGGNGSKSGREKINGVVNLNPGRETAAKEANKHGIHITEGVIQGMNLANPACPRGVKVLRRGQGSNANQIERGLKSLASTLSPDGVVDFVKFAATHPSQVGTLFIAEKQAELAAYAEWRGRYHLPSFQEFWYLVDDEKGESGEHDEVNKYQSKHRMACASPPAFDENRHEKKRKCSSPVIPS